jgi:hypothetical protein
MHLLLFLVSVTWSFIDNGRHELAKADADVAERIATWVTKL